MNTIKTGNRGRPAYNPTQQDRRRVELMVADGMTDDQMAAALGIGDYSLKTHFRRELTGGRARKRMQWLEMLEDHAAKGNVSALKTLIRSSELSALVRHDTAEKPVREPKLGKKEVQQLEAQNPDVSTPMGELMARRQAESGNLH